MNYGSFGGSDSSAHGKILDGYFDIEVGDTSSRSNWDTGSKKKKKIKEFDK